jgi:hypothetical protein
MKTIRIVLLFFIIAGPCYAQFNIGLKGGATFSTIIYDANPYQQNVPDTEILPGIMGGITFQAINEKKAGLQFELLYIQKGFKTKYDSANNSQYERSIDYLSLPFLMHISFGNKSFNISLLLGPYGSYAISSREVLTDGSQSTSRDYEYDPEIDNRFEFGLQGGIGLRNAFSFGIIEIQASLCFTFTSLYKWEAVNKDPEMDRYFILPEVAQNQVYQLSISYYYPF